jgi:hypothetical protein
VDGFPHPQPLVNVHKSVPDFRVKDAMADSPYLIALALVDFAGRRALPLNGKSIAASAAASADSLDDPGPAGHALALELLLRLWQRSDEAPLQRAAGAASLLLLEVPMEAMIERLPRLKADWIGGGETAALLSALEDLATRGWTIRTAKYEPVHFIGWP